MTSNFEQMAAEGAALFREHFGQRDGDGILQSHIITLPSGLLVLWEAAVSSLKDELFEEQGKVVTKQICTLTGPLGDLAEFPTLHAKTTVVVEKYGVDQPFNVDVPRCEYGGPLVVIGLIRKPINKFGQESARISR
jgi:hypothetical protein